MLSSYVDGALCELADGITAPNFDAEPDSPLEAFIAEAPRHPVFQIQKE